MFFQDVFVVRIEDAIVRIATEFKQKKRMSLDSLIAATALYYNFPLVTNNENDFSHINGLTIINPLV